VELLSTALVAIYGLGQLRPSFYVQDVLYAAVAWMPKSGDVHYGQQMAILNTYTF
jgi:hypothetical protein